MNRSLSVPFKLFIYSMIILAFVFTTKTFAEQIPALNNVPIQDLQDNPQYNFWVTGHVIGHESPANQSVFPDAGFLANFNLFVKRLFR